MKGAMRSVLAAVVVLGLVLSVVMVGLFAIRGFDGGGGSRSGPPERRPSTASADDVKAPPHANLWRYYQQKLKWKECDGDPDLRCSTLTVPLDYTKLDTPTIKLALLKWPAERPKQKLGALVVNPGGPGAPGTAYAAAAGQVFRQPILDYFDIVGFDPRGTGKSSPVDCLSDADLDAYLSGDPDPDTPDEEVDFMKWADRIGAGCVEKSGALASHISTAEAARDMDVLRAALGEEKLDYFGASYGTKLGATYAELFPKRVGHLVLDGAVDVSLDNHGVLLGQAGGFERALRAYVADCVKGGGCFLGDSVDEGLAWISDLLERIDKQPLETDGPRELKIGNAFYGLVLPLYNRDTWSMLTSALKAAGKGDGSELLTYSDYYSSREAGGGYSDNSSEAIGAINCLDDPSAIDAAQVPDYYDEFEKVSPTFGRVFAWSLAGCAGQVAKSVEPEREIRGAGAPPIIVTGTTRDPATPMEWAVALADQLESGVLIERDGDGHTAYNSGNACVDEAIEAYLLDGTVPKDGLKC